MCNTFTPQICMHGPEGECRHIRQIAMLHIILCYVTLCVGGLKASAGQYKILPSRYCPERGQYPDIAREGGF